LPHTPIHSHILTRNIDSSVREEEDYEATHLLGSAAPVGGYTREDRGKESTGHLTNVHGQLREAREISQVMRKREYEEMESCRSPHP